MSVVTYFVETSQAYLDTAAETQFGAVAATVGTLLVLGTTLVVILVGINMIYQYRAMDGHTAFWLAVKIGLIGIFATNWMQFNAFSSAILYGIDSIAGALVASVGGGSPGPSGTFAEEFDRLNRRRDRCRHHRRGAALHGFHAARAAGRGARGMNGGD